jgi:hypothetical protein
MVMAVEATFDWERPMSTNRNDEANLRKAIADLQDLDAELEERSAVRGLCASSAAREDMLYQLDHARKLLAALERQAPSISCISYQDGKEVVIDVHKARTWCHLVEARIMRVCGGEIPVAAS